MMMRDIRLGDDIDDFCVRCKRVMNHNVVSVLNGQAAKVRCRTCHSDHDFRHEQAPPPKVDARKAALFNEVLKKVNPDAVAVDIDVEEVPEVDIAIAIEPESESEADIDLEGAGVVVVEEPAPVGEAPKPKAKAKGRGKK